jgi:hypothetical protein
MSRTVTLTPEMLASLSSLASAKNIHTLSLESAQEQLSNASILAKGIYKLPPLDEDIHDLQSQLAAQEHALQEAHKINSQHLRTIDVLTTSTSTTKSLPASSEKHPDPDRFDGSRSKLRGFLGQLRLKVSDRQRFPNDQDQLRYAASRLEGPALDQVLPYLRDDRVDLANFAALIKILENAFDDPDRAGTAQRRLRSLKQGNKEFSVYYAEFQRYAPETGWDEVAKRFALQEGLSRDLQTALVAVDEPENLDRFVELCQKIDQKLRRLSPQSRTNQNPPRNSTYPPPSTSPSTSTGTHPGPMDLSASRRTLTPEERITRMREGRCLYCGGLGHMAKECPKKSPRTWNIAAATTTSEPVIQAGNVQSQA